MDDATRKYLEETGQLEEEQLDTKAPSQIEKQTNPTPSNPPKNFKVVPFNANIQEGQDLSVAGQQLEKTLIVHEQNGWEYVRMEKVSVTINPGCLGSLFRGPSEATYDYIIFKQRP